MNARHLILSFICFSFSSYLSAQSEFRMIRSYDDMIYNNIDYEDFVIEKVTVIEKYQYKINLLGRASKDSTLLFRKVLDTVNRKIYGECNKGEYYWYYRYKIIDTLEYDIRNRLVKKLSYTKSKDSKRDNWRYDKIIDHFTYHDNDSIETRTQIKYSRYKNRFDKKDDWKLDTFVKRWNHHYDAKWRKEVTDGNTFTYKWFYTIDGKLAKYCEDEDFAFERTFSYDSMGRIDFFVDSHKWSQDFENYNYCYQKDSFLGVEVTSIDFRRACTHPAVFSDTLLENYDDHYRITKMLFINRHPRWDMLRIYDNQYKDAKLISIKAKLRKDSYKLYFTYSNTGLLIERKEVRKGRVRSVYRYYYK